MIARACCVCGSQEIRPLLVDHQVPVGRCAECGFIYCVRVPEAAALAIHYTESYADADGWLREMQFNRQLIFPLGLEQLRQLGAAGRLLDVGCSVGLFLVAARDAGFEVRGVELSPAPARFAREHFGLEVFTGTLRESPLEPASFEVVTLWDVLEHLPDPRAALSDIACLLRPGGVLAVRVPDGEFHLWKIRLLRPWFGRRFTWFDVPNHLNHFRPHTLARLLDAAGFTVERVRPGAPHLWNKPLDWFKLRYYRAAELMTDCLGWQVGNCFEVYARRR